MKAYLLIFLCVLGFGRVKADDFFGVPTGPRIPSATPDPTIPVTVTPAMPAPKIIKSTPAPMTPAPTTSAPATTALPPTASATTLAQLRQMGPLQSDLKAWFAFNSRENGGLVWSAMPLQAALSEAVELRRVDGRSVANFTAKAALLEFAVPVDLGTRYTLAAWVSFPITGSNGTMLFRGSKNDLLNVKSGLFETWVTTGGAKKQAFGESPKSGWHHLALCVDGAQSALYVDGKLLGSVPGVVGGDLAGIGNHVNPKFSYMNATEMDDVCIFGRELREAEILGLMKVRYPVGGGLQSGTLDAPRRPATPSALR